VVDEAESIGDEQLRAAAARFRARIEEEGR